MGGLKASRVATGLQRGLGSLCASPHAYCWRGCPAASRGDMIQVYFMTTRHIDAHRLLFPAAAADEEEDGGLGVMKRRFDRIVKKYKLFEGDKVLPLHHVPNTCSTALNVPLSPPEETTCSREFFSHRSIEISL